MSGVNGVGCTNAIFHFSRNVTGPLQRGDGPMDRSFAESSIFCDSGHPRRALRSRFIGAQR